MQFPSRLLKISSFCLAILPACFLGILIQTYSVNVPYWDQWAIGSLFEKVHNGSLSFSDLFAQHNESRKFFPRLVFISLGYLTHWDVRYEMWVIFLLACLVSLNVYCLGNLTIGGSTIKRLFIAAISNLFIFAPIQWQNWLWGIQIVVFIPIACITTCILVAYSGLGTRAKFLISMCLSTISTFSYANGILCWIVVLPVLVLKSRNELTKKRWLIFVWIAGFISNAVIYFYNYKKPSQHPSFSEALAHPQQAIHYFLSFLGAPLGFGTGIKPLTAATIIGFALILLLLASCLYLLKFSTDALLHRMAGWLTIGLYTVISATITTLGRVGFGVQQSLDSRYTTFSVYLAVSLVHIVPIIADDINSKSQLLKIKKLVNKCTSFLPAIILVLHLLTSVYAVEKMRTARIERLQAKSCLLFINIVQEEECLTKKVYPDIATLKYTANALDNLGFLKPGLVKSSRIQDIKGVNELSSENYGWFDTLTKVSTDVYLGTGWAVLPERGEPSDSVVLTYENVNGDSTVFSVVDTKTVRNDVAKTLKNDSYSESGWQKHLSFSEFLKDSIKINAWAFDSNAGKAFKLNGNYVIQTNLQANVAIPGVTNVREINFKSSPNTANGFFDGITDGSSGPKIEVPKTTLLKTSGWAIISNEDRPADMVLLTYGDINSLIAVAPVNVERPDVAKVLKNPAYKNSGWNTIINPSSLPNDRVVLKAWAYNSARKEATELNNSLQVIVLK